MMPDDIDEKEFLVTQILEYDILIQSYVEDDDPIPETELRNFSVKQLEEHFRRQEARLKILVDLDYPRLDTFFN